MMNWTLSNPEATRKLERAFRNRGIDFSAPGFCDHPNFLRAEQENPRFLEAYAQYVEARQYSDEYLADARRKIEVAAEAVRAAIAADGRLGACVDACGMLGRMLDRLGVWNYVAKSSLTVHYPASSGLADSYFYAVDERETAAPHAIVVAPPFYVVDVTAKYQAYDGTHAEYLQDKILMDRYLPGEWGLNDLLAPEVALVARTHGMSLRYYVDNYHGHMLEVAEKLPARRLAAESPDRSTLDYIIVAVGGMIEPLEGVVGYRPCNRTALEIFNEDVLPALQGA